MKFFTARNIIILCVIFSQNIFGQTAITFDSQGWTSDQILPSSFNISNYSFSSSEPFYTNYGYNFDVNSVSLYYVYQNSQTDKITITSPNNGLVKLVSFAACQVSGISTDSLVVEGWNNSVLKYSQAYPANGNWVQLTLNYDNINKIVIRLDSVGTGGLTDYNFDNFNFGVATFLPPTLSSPANNSSGVSLTPVLTWSSVVGAARYRLEVNSKSDFTGTVIYDNDTLTSASKQIGGLIENTTYYWRVTAYNSSGNPSDTSSNFNFTTSQTNLSSASNGAMGVPTSPTLSWNKTAGASTYRLEVNTKSDFTGTVAFDNSAITDTMQALSGLANNTTYYWRVTASSNVLAKTAAPIVYSFTTQLAAATLSSPANNSSGVTLSPTLTWSAVAGANKYRLEVNTKSDFTGSVIYDRDTVSLPLKQIGGLYDNTTYYWRVTALTNAGNISNVSSIFMFTTSQSVLIAATNGAIGVSTSPTLAWNKTPGANTYRLEVNTKSDFTGTVVFDNNTITDTLQALSGLANNTTYYWRVTAGSNVLAKTASSNVFSFTTQLATALLSSPANNSSGVSLSPTLSWSAVAGANTYRLEVNTKSDFTGTVIYDQNTLTTNSKMIGGLADNITYFWRVSAFNSAGNISNVSSAFSFTTGQSVLVTATNGAMGVSTSPTLTWNKTTGASTYRLEVNTKSDFTGTVIFDNSTITDTLQALSGLANNTTYYWRVTAKSVALAKTATSNVYSFTTKLATAALSSPANNTSGASLTPTLTWSAVSGANTYRLEVNTKSDFTGTVIYDQNTLTSTSKTIGGLSDNITYFWRITALNSAGNTSDASSAFNFTTGQSVLIAATNGAIGVSTSPMLTWNKTTGASSYRLEVNTKSDFTGTVVFDNSTITDTLQSLSGLANNTTYYWRVTANSNVLAKTASSIVYNFTTRLATTTLSSPSNNAPGVSLSPTLSWSAISGADKYRLEVNTKSDFTGTITYDQSTLTSTSKTIGGLSDNITYYWRVTALNNAGNTSNVSSIFSFTTGQSELVAAANGAMGVSTSPTLTWNRTSGAGTYRLEVNTRSDFTGTVVFDNSSITDTMQALSGLANNTTYYWRVTASSNVLAKTATSIVYSFTTRLATTTLSSPANASQGVSLSPTLTWSVVAGADKYRLEINTKSDFTGTVIYDQSSLTAASKMIGGLSDNITYYWRVTALNSAGNTGDASIAFSFTTGQSVLVAAANGAMGVSTSPTLTWNRTSGANTYRLEVNTKSDFTGTAVFDNNTITDTLQALNGLANNTTYYWRVTASSNVLAKTAASNIYSFTTKLINPSLVSPSNNATGISLVPLLSWSSVAGADKYRLEVNTKGDFTGTVIFNVDTISTAKKPISGLSNNSEYFWRVTALNSAGNFSDVSSVNDFTTTNTGAIVPLNGSLGVALSTTIKWISVAGATNYELQVDTSSNFSSTVFYDDSTLTDTLASVSSLAYNTKYYWRVRAGSSAGMSNWSAAFSFTTKLAAATLNSPANNAAGISLSPALSWSAVIGANRYRLEVNSKSDFTGSVIYDNDTLSNASKMIGGLSDNNTYFWRVTALSNTGNTSDLSGAFSFTTIQSALVSETNGAIGISTSPTLTWNRTQGATTYRLEVNTKSDFTGTVIFDNSAIADTLQALSGLANNTIYYWRVTAHSTALAKTAASNVYSFTTKLAATSLSSPVNNESNVSLSPTLIWGTVSGADRYRLEVNTSSDFTGSVIYDNDTLGTTTKMIGGLADNIKYYWRVTAHNSAGNTSDVSSVSSFTTGQVVLTAAANGATGISTSPELGWNKTAGASSYRLEVNTKPDFTGTVIFDNSTLTDTLQPLSGLGYNTTYFWRVTANSNAITKTGSSDVYSFTTKLAAATLSLPSNKATGVSLSPILSWSAVAGADKYRLEVNTKNDFSGAVVFNSDTTSRTSQKVNGLSKSSQYFWRVTALNNAGNSSDTSSTFIFTTTAGVTGIEALNGIIPDKYELYQNYPNPFNPSTIIRYGLPADSRISIVIYNILGQEIKELLNNTETAGYHEVTFNAHNLASGIYFYRITAVSTNNNKEFVETKKFILMK